MRVAAIDLGTNSFLCLIADITDSNGSRKIHVVSDTSRVVRLGENVNRDKVFSPGALARAEDCFREFSTIILRGKVDKVLATATSAARDVKNGGDFLNLGKRYGIPISIISGKREAELSFLGALSGLSQKENVAVVDVGGGSTEIIVNGNNLHAESFDVGVVRLTEMFIHSDPPKLGDRDALRLHARKVFSKAGSFHPQLAIAVAGTPTTLACVEQKIEFDEKKVEGFFLKVSRLKELEVELSRLTQTERCQLKGLEPKRADVIVAGTILLQEAAAVLNIDQYYVSTRGLRYGAALHYEEF